MRGPQTLTYRLIEARSIAAGLFSSVVGRVHGCATSADGYTYTNACEACCAAARDMAKSALVLYGAEYEREENERVAAANRAKAQHYAHRRR